MDFLKGLYREMTRNLEFRRRQLPAARMKAEAVQGDRGATVSLDLGRFFIGRSIVDDAARSTFDFVVPGLAAIAASRNVEIDFAQPVSRSMAEQLERLRFAFRLWSLSSVSEPRVNLHDVVPDPRPAEGAQRILCMSGGADSTAAAIRAARGRAYTHGLLIAGADYPDADHPGFRDLQPRVARIAERLGLELVTVETDLRKLKLNWELTHGLLLAMALHYHAPRFAEGGVGLDSPLSNDLVMHPWGSSSALFDMLSTRSFPLHAFNPGLRRTEKLRLILETDPDLFGSLSVCWRDVSSGENCGKCFKCLRTRVGLDALDFDGDHLFRELPPLSAFADMMRVPRTFKGMRTMLVTVGETQHFMREGPEKERLGQFIRKLRAAYVRRMPYR